MFHKVIFHFFHLHIINTSYLILPVGQKYYKTYYLKVSGPNLEDIDREQALLSIGDFETLTYERKAFKTVSRLELLVSPCSLVPGMKEKFCMHRLDSDMFEVIEDNGHLGCGFIPPDLLLELLGKSKEGMLSYWYAHYWEPYTLTHSLSLCLSLVLWSCHHTNCLSVILSKATRKFAVQVRVIGPSSVGIAKGMLMVKDGISKIQLPTSMVKVNKSKIQPLHTDVILNINSHFQSKTQWIISRLFDNQEDGPPTKRQLKEIKPICEDTLRVLSCKVCFFQSLE